MYNNLIILFYYFIKLYSLYNFNINLFIFDISFFSEKLNIFLFNSYYSIVINTTFT